MSVLEIIKAVFFGIVEGITEWLPVSSTGHLILLDEFVQLKQSDEFKEMFNVVIQLGAIMAVVLLYWKQIFPFSFKEKPVIKKDIFSLWFKILTACIPAAVVGLLFDEVFEKYFYNPFCVAIALIVIGALFIWIESKNKTKEARVNSLSEITYKDAVLVGVFQLIAAIFPGTSRSGSTIMGGLVLGISRSVIAEFTFFLAIPVMFGASLLKIVKFGFDFTSSQIAILLIAMIVAFVVSVIVIKFLMGYIKKHDFKVFGWYRIVLGALVIMYFVFIKGQIFA
ncbi:MAG: undecaprenyl-diphosphate phosphatase [Oscillospiraceae bacterium]|nr:undecaprenyl-diphosphate phosphatase [Oscillospiraceae bacterium]MBQ9981519.1 undecaprenyl-diphosphate phosphatase [Oscillospiraceae bacterium]